MFIAVGVVALALLVFVSVVACRPATFRVQRSTTIAAPSSVVFGNVVDLHQWAHWSPYEKCDPNVKKTYAGPSAGNGSSLHYVGKKIGEGRMTVVESRTNERVAIQAEYLKPFTATNAIEFTIAPAAEGVSVTWATHGRNSFFFKAFSLFVDMDKLLGKDFEAGLADLKKLSEASVACA
jgi:hypothetical protein